MTDTPTTTRGRVSLVMATYRRAHCIGDTVRQLLDAQTRPPYEIIVVNNDGADGAEDAVRAALPADPRIRVTSCLVGKQGACRNLGLSLATGEYVAFVDDDDDYAPTYIEALAGALDLGIRSVRAQIQTCGMASPDCTGKPTIAHHPLTPNTMARRDALTATWGEPPSEDRDYWERHPVEGAIDDCVVFTCRGPGQHSPRNNAEGGSWRVRFIISVLVTRDDAKALPAFLASLREQTYRHFIAVLVDGTGEDKLRRTFEKLVADDARFAVQRSDDVTEHALARVMRAASLHPLREDDVVVLLRANERLAHTGVLNRLSHVYDEHHDVWATFGACATEPFVPAWPQASFPPSTYAARTFRAHSGVIGEYAPLSMRAAVAMHLCSTLGPADLQPAAGATRTDEDADLPLFLAVLEAAGAAHVYPMADVQVVKHLDTAAYRSISARQAAMTRKLALRAHPTCAPLASLPAMHAEKRLTIGSSPAEAAPAEAREMVPPDTTPPRIVSAEPLSWIGPVYDPTGYGNELRQFVLALDDLGTQATLRAVGNRSERFKNTASARLRDRLDVMLAQPQGADYVGVLHLPPSFLQRVPGASYTIARTMFETDGLNRAYVKRCNDMDELWVPSAFNAQTFRKAGVRTHIVQVPGGIDSVRFRPGHEPYPIAGAHGTVFLSTVEWKPRKGWQTLLDAWADAFAPTDDVTLVFRSSVPGTSEADSAPEILRQIDAHLAQHGRTRADVADIVVLGRSIADDDIPGLYAAAHVYVGATSGEGWGYPYMEAMASGLPTIATRWSGHLEFMHDANSLLCEVERMIPALDPFVGSMPNQRWAQPSAQHLASLLRVAIDDPARARAIATTAREEMCTTWTWARAATIVQDRLTELADRRGKGRRTLVTTANPSGLPASDVPVRWEGPQFTHSSLGLVNRELCAELLAMGGIDLMIRPSQAHDFTPQADTRFAPLAARMQRPPAPASSQPAAVHVAHQWPPSFVPPKEGAWVLMQPWEYGGLPGEWIPMIRDQVDEYWVYCSWQRECAIASGVPAEKVAIVPLGVDPSRHRPDGPRYPLATRKKTKLLAIGGIIPRKGMDLLVETYLRTFTADDDVCLVIKGLSARWAYSGNPGQADFAALPELTRAEGAAEIEFIGDTLDDAAVADLYRACDALVAPFRGEGFGLPIVEAMATGLPVIVTHAGPVFDLADEETAYLIPAGQSTLTESATGFPPSALGYWWADPDTKVLSRHMRHVVDHPEESCAVGARGRARVLERFTVAHGARAAAERLRALATVSPFRYAPPHAYSPTHPAYPLDQPRSTVFLHFPWWHRAPWRDVLRSYISTFGADDDVSLVLALDPAQGLTGEQVASLIASVREESGRSETDMADLLLVPDELHDGVMASLMRAADHIILAPDDDSGRARASAMQVPVLQNIEAETWRAATAAASRVG